MVCAEYRFDADDDKIEPCWRVARILGCRGKPQCDGHCQTNQFNSGGCVRRWSRKASPYLLLCLSGYPCKGIPDSVAYRCQRMTSLLQVRVLGLDPDRLRRPRFQIESCQGDRVQWGLEGVQPALYQDLRGPILPRVGEKGAQQVVPPGIVGDMHREPVPRFVVCSTLEVKTLGGGAWPLTAPPIIQSLPGVRVTVQIAAIDESPDPDPPAVRVAHVPVAPGESALCRGRCGDRVIDSLAAADQEPGQDKGDDGWVRGQAGSNDSDTSALSA